MAIVNDGPFIIKDIFISGKVSIHVKSEDGNVNGSLCIDPTSLSSILKGLTVKGKAVSRDGNKVWLEV
jgi:hypothetical protein